MEYEYGICIYLYNIIYMHNSHTSYQLFLTNLSTFGRSKAPNTAVIRVALFRIDTSGRGVLPHWCHGTGLWFMDSTCAMDWSGMFTSDLQISGYIYNIYCSIYYWIIITNGFASKISKSTSQFWDHSNLLWKSERCFMRFAAINMFSGPVPATHEPWAKFKRQGRPSSVPSNRIAIQNLEMVAYHHQRSIIYHIIYQSYIYIYTIYIYIMYIHTYKFDG